MKKNNNLKKKKIKIVILFCIIQLLIIALFVSVIVQRQQIAYNDTEKITFIADEIKVKENIPLSLHTQQNEDIYIEYNSIKYKFGVEYIKEYKGNDLIQKLSKEKLTILYEKRTKHIIDLRSNETIFYTIDDYNSEQNVQLTTGIIIISILEVIFLVISIFYLLVFR